jgi:hypothetical protein
MRTTQGQAAFGHNVQATITDSYTVKKIQIGTVSRVLPMGVERIYFRVQTPTNQFSVNYFNLQMIPAKLSRSAKQHPSNSAHFMRRCEGVCRYIFTKSSFLLTSEPSSRRVPCVGRVWLAQAHTQAFQTPPST